MKNISEKARIIFLILFLAIVCLLPFFVFPSKSWYIILIIFGIPTLLVLAIGLLSNRIGLSSNPKRLRSVSYFVVAFASFCLSTIVFYLTKYLWNQILLYSTGIGLLSVMIVRVNIFVWSKVKKLEESNSTCQE